jgi:hypothetical protein
MSDVNQAAIRIVGSPTCPSGALTGQEQRQAYALARLVQLYEAWGKKDAATKWGQELAAMQPRVKPAGP